MDLTLHPAAAQSIDAKGTNILTCVEKLKLSMENRSPAFQTERVVSANITDKDIIGEPHVWLQDANGQRVLAFIHRDDGAYGFTSESYSLIEGLSDEIFKARWARDFLSKTFIENTILEWCCVSFKSGGRSGLANSLVSQSTKAIRKFTVWAPIAHLDVEAPFNFGPAQIAPITTAMFDNLENKSVENSPQHADNIKAHFSKLRKTMQGRAAVVLEIEAERDYAYEKGWMIAADVVGLLRFLSPSSFRFWIVCPNALLGAELIPKAHALLLEDDGSFSAKSKIVPKDIAFWRLSASEIAAMQNTGLSELGGLVSENQLNQFQQRLRACILAYTKGTTFSDVADRLVYACSALEGLLLKNTSEPIRAVSV
jgi:hypothetical protein